MKNLKGTICLVLCLALLLGGGLLGALAENTSELVGNMYVSGLPIVKEKESFTLLVDNTAEPEKMELYQMFEEQTNVHIDWQAYPYEVANEKKQLMFSSGEYVDAVGGWLLSTSDITRYGIKEGAFTPLEDLIAEYAPRLSYVLDNFPGARQAVTSPDGHIYTIPLCSLQPATTYITFINKTWLDKLGLDVPTTTDELYTVLKAFKEQDPNGNGEADEIPMGMFSSYLGLTAAYFGLPATSDHLQVNNGELVFVPTTEGYKDFIKFFAKLYKEGLIDEELFTQDRNQYRAKGKEDPQVYGVFMDWDGTNVVETEQFKRDYVTLPVLSSPNCSEPQWAQGDPSIFRTQFAISATAKNPATIVRYFDFIFDEDNAVQACYGPYGKTIQRNADGSFEFVALPEGETVESVRSREAVSSLPYAIMPETLSLIPKNEFKLLKAAQDAVYAPSMIKEPKPAFWLTVEESDQAATVKADLDKYVADRRAAWITGQADIDAEWDAYMKQLDALGLATYMDVYTAVYTRSK